jgi:FixJ family two-component response regulator
VRERTKPIIYVIDDERAVLRAMKRLILSMGMSVETFSSGRDFLEVEIQNRNVCVIVDAKMPEMGGMEIHKELVKRTLNVPVILMTAFDTDRVRSEAKKAGIAGYFRKPVDDQALLDAIHWVLDG